MSQVIEFLNQPFTLLIVGTTLTTFIGNQLSGKIQRRNFDYQFKKDIQRNKVLEAKLVFDQVTSLLDKRNYRARKLHMAFMDKELGYCDLIEEKYKDFNEILYDWNDSLNTNICRIEQSFGREMRDRFEKKICSELVTIRTLLRRFKFNDPKKPKLDEIISAINETNQKTQVFTIDMLKAINQLESNLNI